MSWTRTGLFDAGYNGDAIGREIDRGTRRGAGAGRAGGRELFIYEGGGRGTISSAAQSLGAWEGQKAPVSQQLQQLDSVPVVRALVQAALEPWAGIIADLKVHV
jgi:hypothetical protein